MMIVTNKVQREIVHEALERQRKLAIDTGGNLKRMDQSDASARAVQGTNKFLQEKFDEIGKYEEGEIMLDKIPPAAAKTLRNALALWARAATRADTAATQLSLVTNLGDRQSHAQKLVDQVQEQLGLAFVDINALADGDTPGDAEKTAGPEEDLDVPATSDPASGKAPPRKARGAAAATPVTTDDVEGILCVCGAPRSRHKNVGDLQVCEDEDCTCTWFKPVGTKDAPSDAPPASPAPHRGGLRRMK